MAKHSAYLVLQERNDYLGPRTTSRILWKPIKNVIRVIDVQSYLSALNCTFLFPGNASPPPNITSWFQSKGHGKTRDDTASQIPHDIYVIGTQEDPLGEKDWIDIVRGTLRDITNISFKQVQHFIYGIWYTSIHADFIWSVSWYYFFWRVCVRDKKNLPPKILFIWSFHLISIFLWKNNML